MINFYNVTIFLVIYLICSINPAIIICKKRIGEDIRKLGSGNAGSANVMRVLGRLWGFLVIILDEVKVFVALFISLIISKLLGKGFDDVTFRSIFILATIIGHCFPIYYGLRGGKGVIVGITVMAILEPRNALICIISGLIILFVTRTVSKATLSGLILYVIIAFVSGTKYLIPVLISSVIIMYKHRQSIYRIVTKQENKF